MTRFSVRPETPGDREAVRRVNRLAFGREYEADLADALRDGGYATVSVVATSEEDGVVGHALFSEVSLNDGKDSVNALALAPVAVLPEFQGKGAGTVMISSGLELCKVAGCDLILVLGDPDYYRRFGFSTELAKDLKSPYPREYFMALRLNDACAVQGAVRYPPPFG